MGDIPKSDGDNDSVLKKKKESSFSEVRRDRERTIQVELVKLQIMYSASFLVNLWVTT